MNNKTGRQYVELCKSYGTSGSRRFYLGGSFCLYPWRHYLLFAMLAFLVMGCGSTLRPAPVINLGSVDTDQAANFVDEESDGFYIVKRGDTLYSIAIDRGINLKALAELNRITDLSTIEPGQRINLLVPEVTQQAQPIVSVLPLQLGSTSSEVAADTSSHLMPLSGNMGSNRIKTEPKGLKLPYSEQAVIKMAKLSQASLVLPAIGDSKVDIEPADISARIEIAPVIEVPQIPVVSNATLNSSGIEWIWPTEGKILEGFSSKTKGVQISGNSGQAVFASAAGDVVYSGNGLRGYGNLLIIKHSNKFLSAYAHNSKIMVQEGEAVVKGQKIAEMGSTDADTVKLHFEIRKQGRPVDPLKYLPAKSG